MTQETSLAVPATYDEISNMAKAFVQSGMFTDTKQLSQAIVKIQAGRELGLPPVYSMQNINMIRNRLTTSANTMAMLVKKSGRYNYRIKEHTDKACIIIFFETDNGKWVEVGDSTFTIEDAKRADLVKPESGWAKYPKAMLFSRAISQGARMYAPDAIGGIYTDEEIRSIPAKPETETSDIPKGQVEKVEIDMATGEMKALDTPPDKPETTQAQSEPAVTPGQPLDNGLDAGWVKEQFKSMDVDKQRELYQWLKQAGAKGRNVWEMAASLSPEKAKELAQKIEGK